MAGDSTGRETIYGRLQPYQAELVKLVVADVEGQITVLESGAGLGATFAAAAAASRMRALHPESRLLYLVPSPLRPQVGEALAQFGEKCIPADRYFYREALAARGPDSVWTIATTFVLSVDFAKQDDVSTSLAACSWDLVIAEEVHWYGGARGKLLEALAAVSSRMLLTVLNGEELAEWVRNRSPVIVRWQRDELFDADGGRLFSVERPSVHDIEVQRSPEEAGMMSSINRLCVNEPKESKAIKWLNTLVWPSYESSPAALETVLRRLLASQESLSEWWDSRSRDDDAALDSWTPASMEWRKAVVDRDIVQRLLEAIDSARLDSKLIALGSALQQITSASDARICVLASFVSTIHYLSSELELRGLFPHVIHGGLSVPERRKLMQQFLDDRGILLVSTAVLAQDWDLGKVSDLVLYDVPKSDRVLRALVGRFDRPGRQKPLRIHAFREAPTEGNLVSDSLNRLRTIVGAHS